MLNGRVLEAAKKLKIKKNAGGIPLSDVSTAHADGAGAEIIRCKTLNYFKSLNMRLNFIKPSELTPEQKPLYNDMKSGIETTFKGFKAIDKDGALIGSWNPSLQFQQIGGAMWSLVKVLSLKPTLPKPIREVVILVTGAKFHSGYELYAYVLMAELRGLDDNTIVADQRPANLKDDESVAYDVASSLIGGGVLPELFYKKATEHFGTEGTAELIYLIGLYCMVSITLNGFDVPILEVGS